MLGRALSSVFSDYDLTLWDMADVDITDREILEQKVFTLRPELIINAAAYTDVDGCEENEDSAVQVNGLAIGYLAAIAKKIGSILVHYSTDYVFDGKDKDGYAEDAKPNPVNAYGRSKLRGEEELVKKGDKYYLLRTSWLYGDNGKNFIETILTKAVESDNLRVVDDQFGKPTYTLDLAQKTREIIEQGKPFGIYHVTNETKAGGISWYEFAQAAIRLKGLAAQVEPCATEEFPRPAKRPQYSALVNTKLEPMRGWEEALKEYLVVSL